MNSTDCEFRRESNSDCVFWHFAAFTARHRHTLLAVYAMLPMSTVVVTSARPTQCRWSFHQFGARHLAAARAWNDLLPMIRASPSTNNLKHSFFIQHFTDLTTGLSELNCAKCLCSVLRCLLNNNNNNHTLTVLTSTLIIQIHIFKQLFL